MARRLYQHSRRADRPFLAVNCAAMPEALLESELFGHEQGAFTGAERRRIGRFEQADGGTLFLDEIGDMSPAVQAKMLRVLQEQRFERVGGSETRADATCACWRPRTRTSKPRSQAGRFRKDLYYRLQRRDASRVPPLRERREDVPELAHTSCSASTRSWACDMPTVSPGGAGGCCRATRGRATCASCRR